MKSQSSFKRLLNPIKSDQNELGDLMQKYHDQGRELGDSHRIVPKSWTKTYYKSYHRFDDVLLPGPHLPKALLSDVLEGRSSSHSFKDMPLGLEELSTFLYYSCGERKSFSEYARNRMYPSAGARYPIETYIFPLRIKSLSHHFSYHYNVRDHKLERLFHFDLHSLKGCFLTGWVLDAACIVVMSARFERTSVKYGAKAPSLILLEAGHIGQNMYLVSKGLNFGCCTIAGYWPDALSSILKLDEREIVVYTAVVGMI